MPLLHFMEHFAVSVSAITGVLAARGKSIDLFGVIVLALVAAFGGGTVRDVALGDFPVIWIRDPQFFYNAAITAIVVFYVVRWRDLPQGALQVADAFGLALFTMIGVKKALAHGAPPGIAAALGVTTGVVGGILRDLLTDEIPLVFRRETYLYATAAFGGSVLFLAVDQVFPEQFWSPILGAAAILSLRLAGIRWRIALPVFRFKSETGKKSSHG